MNLAMHPNMTNKLMLHSRGHVEALARHLFKNDPVGLEKVSRVFGENRVPEPELKPPPPQNYVMHHIPQ